DEFKANDPKSQMLRFHTQTAGVQLTAQQPEVNLIRVSIQALAAVLGGTQSLHTNSFDEALALPSARAARLAIRTQQVIASETDLTATADPFAGSYEIEPAAYQVAQEIDNGERVIVGVNKYQADSEERYEPLKVDPAIEAAQARKLSDLRAARDNVSVSRALSVLKKSSENESDNVLYPIRDALRAGATLGETCDALRDVWGEYRPD